MSDTTVPVQNPAVSDTLLDAEQLVVSTLTVARERIQLAGAIDVEIARVEAAEPDTADYGLVVRPVRQGVLSDFGGTIATGGTAQTIIGPNLARRFLLIENLDPTEDLWLDFTSAAVLSQPSILIPHGETFRMDGAFVSTEEVSLNATTTAHPFAAKEG